MSGDNNNDKELLERRGKRRELIATVFGFIVGSGLLIEYGDEIFDCFAKRQLPSRQLFGGLLVTAGVFGEVLFARLALKTSQTLQERADSDVSIANAQAAQALERAAEANRLTEVERVARVRIEQQLSERSLTPEQMERIRVAVQQFTGRRVTLVSYPHDQEAGRLIRNLAHALSPPLDACDASGCFEMTGESTATLFGIRILPQSDDNSHFAETLATALINEGNLFVEPVGTSVAPGAATLICVGCKPQSPLPNR